MKRPGGADRELGWYVRLLLGSYPRWWRLRYDDEMRDTLLALREDGGWRRGGCCDLLRGLVDAWLHPTHFPTEHRMTDRTTRFVPRAAWGLLLFVLAGSAFAKLVEDPPFTAAARQHQALSWWGDALVVCAVATALVMTVATLPSFAALARSRSGCRVRLPAPLVVVPVSALAVSATLLLARQVADGTSVHRPSHVGAFLALALVTALGGIASTLALVRVATQVPEEPSIARSRTAAMVATGVLTGLGAVAVLGWTLTAEAETPHLLHTQNGLLATPTLLTVLIALAGLGGAAVLCGSSAVGALSSRGAAQRSSR